MPDLAAYAARLGLALPAARDAAALETLLRAHRLAIPFENIEARLGRPVPIDAAAVADKLIARGRGGYCFEHEALFRGVLDALGFAARPVLARVWREAGAVPPRTHVLDVVTVAGDPWIADPGFGGGYAPAMPLREGEAAGPDGARHRLSRDADHGWMLSRGDEAGVWTPQYSFTGDVAHPADLEQANHWVATRPGTRFTTLTVLSRPTPDGFVSLVDRRLVGDGPPREIGPAEWRTVVRDRIGVRIDDTDLGALGLF